MDYLKLFHCRLPFNYILKWAIHTHFFAGGAKNLVPHSNTHIHFKNCVQFLKHQYKGPKSPLRYFINVCFYKRYFSVFYEAKLDATFWQFWNCYLEQRGQNKKVNVVENKILSTAMSAVSHLRLSEASQDICALPLSGSRNKILIPGHKSLKESKYLEEKIANKESKRTMAEMKVIQDRQIRAL